MWILIAVTVGFSHLMNVLANHYKPSTMAASERFVDCAVSVYVACR